FGMKLANLNFPQHTFPAKQSPLDRLGTDSPLWGVGGPFDQAETVLAIAVPGCSEYSRKQTDELTEWVKRPQIGMKGLVYIKCNADGSYKSTVDKFYSPEIIKSIAESAGAEKGDLVL